MRRLRWSFGLALCALATSALGATPALAGPENNPNSQTLTLTCPFGQVTGTTPAGAALLLEGGGVAILQGATTAGGEVLVPTNPGLEQTGDLVQCSYFSERRQEQVIAYVLFVP
jgi:hypothetical protein